jgi:tol-pal system protein YbgF
MKWIGPSILAMASTTVLALGEDWVSIENATPPSKASTSAKKQIAASEPPTQTSSTAQIRLLLDELDILRQEVQALRELTERQGFELRSLKNESKDRYLDLDQRLSQLVTGENDLEDESDQQAGSKVAGSERDSYRQAFSLLKQKKFPASEQSFKQFIKRYPQGQYTPNAYYWLGELLLLQRKYEEARQAFTVVLNQYSTHQKAPDALYKLGVVYERLGRDKDAKQALQRVVKDYQDKAPTTARLAKEYLTKHL